MAFYHFYFNNRAKRILNFMHFRQFRHFMHFYLHVIKKPLIQGKFYLAIVIISNDPALAFRLRDGFFRRLFFLALLPGQQNGTGNI